MQNEFEDAARVMATASQLAEHECRAVFWFMNERLADFEFQTPNELVRAGKAGVVFEYMASIAGGSAG